MARHCDELAAADGYLVVHPNWWAMPPAILKGWIDRVLRQGVAYEFGPGGVVELLQGRKAVVFTTSNTPRDMELALFGDPLENLWRTCIFGFVRRKGVLPPQLRAGYLNTPEHRRGWLEAVRRTIRERFPPPWRKPYARSRKTIN